jgi:uncharacterized protein YndB with AHSA1/START domain
MKQEIIFTRILNASPESVWKCWSEPGFVMRWWGPDGFTSPRAIINFRENRSSVVCMKAPPELGGMDYYNIWSYRKIVPYETIEYIQNLCDEKGNIIDPILVNMPPDFPKDTETTITLERIGDEKTKITFREYCDFGQMYELAKLGLEQCMNKMAAIFPSSGTESEK